MANPNSELGKGCLAIMARSVLVYVLSVVVVLVLAAISIVFGLIVGAFTEAVWGVVAAVFFFALSAFGGGYLFIIGAVVRRKMLLDRAFVPLGLEGSAYRLMFRKYAGKFRGRDAEVYFQRGPNLEILLATNLKARVGIAPDYADTGFAADLFGKQPVPHNVPGMEDLRIWSGDAAWATNLISDPAASQSLRRMLDNRAFFVRSHVKFFPGYVQLQLFGNKNLFRWSVTPELAAEWTNALADLAERAERGLPRPVQELELTSSEEWALKIKRKDTTRFTLYFVAGLIGFFIVISVFVAIFVAVIANM
ncbi:MAG: hypothetical protein J5I65_04860 [Aridibacter famidurans]|nr:hypothetical protein [Aridibacter famidurans]